MHIGIVAGEASGDLLGAGLIKAIKARYPDAVFEGIAGPRMMEAGAVSLFPMEKLSVMGLDALANLRELLGMRRQLIKRFRANPPDVFIGVDAPDFNLTLERKLKQSAIPTVHYVSPSVWAWRQYRIRKIVRSTDLILTLFPFEADFYAQHNMPVRFVGHPLADRIPLEPDVQAVRQRLSLPMNKKIIALLPGSRIRELHFLAQSFVQTAQWCLQRQPELHFVAPMANARTRVFFEQVVAQNGAHLPLTILDGQSHEAMEAADAVLLASGTAALEAMLLKKPMVVAYRVSRPTAWLAKRLLKVPHFSLPNLLAANLSPGESLIKEFVQDQVTAENLGAYLLTLLQKPQVAAHMRAVFTDIHRQLRQNADQTAAQAILQLIHK
jgi:lipid-A-disaccharide synthase